MHPVRCVVILSKGGVADKGVGGIQEIHRIGMGQLSLRVEEVDY